jgi:hypothetical protein
MVNTGSQPGEILIQLDLQRIAMARVNGLYYGPECSDYEFISEVMIKPYLNRVALRRPSVGYCALEKALGRFSCLCGSMRVLLRLETALRKSSFRYHEKSGRAARDAVRLTIAARNAHSTVL